MILSLMKMKIVSLDIKKIGIGKFFPKEDKVELDIFFNDGSDKEIFKIVDTSDAESAAEDIFTDLRKLEKNIHKSNDNKELIVDSCVNIVIKNEDNLIKEISEFIQKIKNKIDGIKQKNVAEGYLDMIRELKNLKVEFSQ
jgi:hypothetical protein